MNRYTLRLITALLAATLWLGTQGNTLSADTRDSLSQATAASLMHDGRHHFERHQPAKALACFTAVASRYSSELPDDELHLCIRAINNCACVYKYFYFDYAQAHEQLTLAYDLCQRHHYDEFLPVVLVNLGDLLNDYAADSNQQASSQRARQLFAQCMEQAVKSRNWELMTTAFFNMANQNYELDLSQYDVLFSPQVPDDTPDLHYVRLQHEGIRLVQQGDYAGARDCFLRQLPVVTTRWAPERDTIATYLSIAHTYELEKDYAHTLEYLNLARQECNDHGIYDNAAEIGNMLSQLNTLMAHRQQRQQWALLAGAAALLLVVGSALLLWKKNRRLAAHNRTLAEENSRTPLPPEPEEKYSHSKLTSEQRDALLERIRQVLESPDIICQQDFTLARMAKLVESNTTYVSQVINETYGNTFSTVVGNYRIREACRRMDDQQHYGNITIEAIASSVGFKSRTAFFTAFKRETGLTPSEHLRLKTLKKD